MSTLGLNSDIASLSIGELIGLYDLSNRADGKSTKTVRWYTEILRCFARYIKENEYRRDISSFNLNVVRNYILYLRNKPKFLNHPFTPEQAEPISPRTVQCHVRVLRAFSSWLYSEDYTKENRLKNLKLPKAPITVMESLTPEEIKQIIDSINIKTLTGSRNHAILTTLLDTGLRASEVANVTLTHLNLQDGYIKIIGKGAKERIVPIGKYVQMTLWSYIDKVRPSPIIAYRDSLFLSTIGKPITVSTIKLVFSRLAKSSGVQKLHAHLCRHTFAINYLLNGGAYFLSGKY